MKEMPDYDLGERFDFLTNNSLYELIKRNIEYDKSSMNYLKRRKLVQSINTDFTVQMTVVGVKTTKVFMHP